MAEIIGGKSFGSHSTTVGFKPSRLLPESKKSESWAKEMCDWVIAAANISYESKYMEYYNLFNGKRDTKQFEYLTKMFGIEFPAKIKHIPLVRPKLNRLIGEEEERVLEFDMVAVDTGAVESKKDAMMQIALRKLVEFINGEIDEAEFKQTENFLRRRFKTNFEIGAHKALEEYIYAHRLHERFGEGFKHRLITGREYYRVKGHRIGEDPILEVIAPHNLYFAPNNVPWVSECDWAVSVNQMSSTEILDAFGEHLSHEERMKLADQRDLYAKQAVKVRTFDEIDQIADMRDVDPDYYANYDADLFDVYEVEYKAIREVMVRKSPNPYDPEKPFIKVLSEEQFQELPNSRKKTVEKRYMQELWKVVRIGVDIYPIIGRVEMPERDTRNPSKVMLSFEGLTHNEELKPFSLIESTYDLQMLYDILHFHKENLIAMSGTKGAVMDLAMMPDFGYGFDPKGGGFVKNLQMWLYYKKMGAMFVDSSRVQNIQFNQAGNYDDTLGTGLAAILETIRHIEEVAGEVISVNRQRMGQQVSARDGQGVNQDAIEQSGLATEPIYNDHDNTKERIMAKVLNIGKVVWKNGKNGAFINRNMEQEMFTLEPEFAIHDYNFFLTNKYQSRRRLEELKQLVAQLSVQGQVEASTTIDIILSTSLQEVEQKLKENVAETEQQIAALQEQQAALEQQAAQAQAESEQFKLQLEAQKVQTDLQAKMAELDLKQRELNHKIDHENKELILEGRRVDLEALQLHLSDNAKEVKND